MKIALVCPDGLSVLLFCKGIIRVLQQAGEVIVVSHDGEYRREIESLGAKSVSVEISRFVDPLGDLRYLCSLFHVFRREEPDAVLNFSTKSNIYGAMSAKLAGVKLVTSHVVGLGSAFNEGNELRARLVRRVAGGFLRLMCVLSRKVWFTNQNDARYFVSQGMIAPEKVVLTKNYLDTEHYSRDSVMPAEEAALRKELGIGEQDKVVIMVARMIWAKGVREFVEAAELLKKRRPGVHFLLVAPMETGSPDAVPEAYVRGRERTGNLRWLGFRADVRQLYAISHLAVLPSYYREGGYPRALLEPMAMGKPVITTDTDGCRGVVDHGRDGYLIPPKDSKSLVDAVEEMISDESKLAEFGKRARVKMVREFDERVIVPSAIKALGFFDLTPTRVGTAGVGR